MTEEGGERFTLQAYYTPQAKRPRRFVQLLRTAVRIVAEADRGRLAVCAALQVALGASLAVQLLLLRRLLGDLFGGTATFGDVVPELAALTVLWALVALAGVVLDLVQRVLANIVGLHTADAVVRGAASFDLVSYEVPAFHDRLLRAQLSAASRPIQLTNGLLGLVGAAIAITAIAGALVVIEPLFALFAFGAFLPALAASNRAGRLVYRFTVEQTERERRRTYLYDVLTTKPHAQELRAFSLSEFLGARHRAIGEELLGFLRTVLRRRVRIALTGQLISSLLAAGGLTALVWFVTADRMSLADAGAAAGAMVLLTSQLRGLTGNAGGLYEAALYLEDYVTFVETARQARAAAPDAPAPPGDVAIAAHDVSFTYPSREAPSLRGASITLRRGEVVAVVGENGSGKTTLAKLLAGLYTPSSGTVTLDGTDVATCDPEQVRRRVAVIFQDFARYELAARDNIAVGDAERFDDEEGVVRAARAAGIHDELAALPSGYDTLLGPEFFGGTGLSGGQWQRVALARAFFRAAPFVILDEPTAALDPRAEAALYDSMRELFAGRGVLLISHRFGSVRSADRIYVLHDGLVAEEGTHAELLAAGGRYAELFRMQASRYTD